MCLRTDRGLRYRQSEQLFDGLKRIDAETGDYYVIGYYSSNADPLKRRRAIEIKMKRPRVQVNHRAEYFLRPK